MEYLGLLIIFSFVMGIVTEAIPEGVWAMFFCLWITVVPLMAIGYVIFGG